MNVFKRKLAIELAKRLAESPNRIQIVGGPRQTGKTTLVRQACEDVYNSSGKVSLYRAVDNPVNTNELQTQGINNTVQTAVPNKPDIEWLVRQWEEARAVTRKEHAKAAQDGRKDTGYVLVLDEIQKIPNWSEAVKGLWDEDHVEKLNLHIVLLGSSPLLLQQGLSESLLGRYEKLESRHWSYVEMAEAFGFNYEEYIYFGGYPGAASFIRDELRWKDYLQNSLIDPYLIKDIMVMARIDKPVLLKNAFELSCEYSGQIFAYNKMLGQLTDAGNVTTLAHYISLLTDAGLVAGLQAYSGTKLRKRASKPKLNVMNTALMSCYSGYTFSQAKADRTYWGRVVESTVGAHLFNTASTNTKVYYWRDRGSEVDFVVKKNKQLLAIEVKSGNKRKPGNLNGLNKFSANYSKAKTLLIGADGLSIQEFLSYPIDYWLDDV
ncbi:hypothetical protein MNBD_GAMMA06-1705 [hydrothermal vent metagenome]|uniref:AAA family ATPase n=1 Tax=hydrothermal vent metagenome TaxID=652676 RepID=A0A3B0X2S1_9ZZZZ